MAESHYYDKADGGICIKCDRCRYEGCCDQTEECDGTNWDFLKRIQEDYKRGILHGG